MTSRRTPPLYSPALFRGGLCGCIQRKREVQLIISDDLFTDVHVNVRRSLIHRSESLVPDSLPFAGFRGVEDVAENRRDYFVKFLRVPEKFMQKVLREGEGHALEQPRIASTAPGGATFPQVRSIRGKACPVIHSSVSLSTLVTCGPSHTSWCSPDIDIPSYESIHGVDPCDNSFRKPPKT